jgi:hypothetical protein
VVESLVWAESINDTKIWNLKTCNSTIQQRQKWHHWQTVGVGRCYWLMCSRCSTLGLATESQSRGINLSQPLTHCSNCCASKWVQIAPQSERDLRPLLVLARSRFRYFTHHQEIVLGGAKVRGILNLSTFEGWKF